MALSFRAIGTWATVGTTSPLTVTIPAGTTTGDMMYCFAVWKDYAITATMTEFAELTEFADGTVSAGDSVGSMKIGFWYKEHDGSESNPQITWSATPVTRTAVIMSFQKGGGDAWDTPAFVSAAITNWTNSAQTVSASSTISVRHAGVVVGIAAIRNDSATFTRPTDAIGESTVTWNGNYVEAPATHASSTTGNDLSGDAGYRLVTTGGFAKTLTQTATLSAAETGSALWVVQGLVGAGPINTTVTPTTLALVLATFAPTVTTTANQSVTPTTAALALAAFAPTVTASAHVIVTPPPVALVTLTYAPTVTAIANQTVTPATAALTTTTYAPTVTTAAGAYLGPIDNMHGELVARRVARTRLVVNPVGIEGEIETI